jgi:hypothetical protein
VVETYRTVAPRALARLQPAIGQPPPGAEKITALLVDGDQNGDYVLFAHDKHSERLGRLRDGGPQSACHDCHHMNHPLEIATGCSRCHADMYLGRDIFDHDRHAQRLGGNAGCAQCHVDPALPKRRANTKPCADCHRKMRQTKSLVPTRDPPTTVAVGYRTAMHELCINCHKKEQKKRGDLAGQLDHCGTCHGETVEVERWRELMQDEGR